MSEKIAIQSVSDIITSKADRKYFTFEDMAQKRYVCFIPQLRDFCKVGSEIEADITAGKTADDSPRLDMIYIEGKPVIKLESKAAGRSYGKSKEELLQIRQLAEAQNRSIQAQTALNRAVDIAIAGQDVNQIENNARAFYQLLQSLILITEAEVIHRELTSTKTPTGEVGQPPTGEAGTADNGGDKDIKERIRELYQQKGWWTGREWTSPEVVKHIKGITGKLDINKASEDDLVNILSDLQVRKESKTE